jgi:hypothetical protein
MDRQEANATGILKNCNASVHELDSADQYLILCPIMRKTAVPKQSVICLLQCALLNFCLLFQKSEQKVRIECLGSMKIASCALLLENEKDVSIVSAIARKHCINLICINIITAISRHFATRSPFGKRREHISQKFPQVKGDCNFTIRCIVHS